MSEVLDLASRRRIYDFLLANPGVHLRFIGKVLGMSTGMLSYHLDYMERNGILKSEEEGHRRRYFIRAFADAQRRVIAILRQDVPRKIIVELLEHRHRTFTELRFRVGVSKSTLSYHLKKMTEREVLIREKRDRESVFRLKDPDGVASVLLENRTSFRDDAVDRFADYWLRLRL